MLNPSRPTGPDPSLELCEKCCNFFINKVASIRVRISCNLSQNFQYGNTSSSVFSNFQAISLSELSDIILNMKSTTSCDVVPTKLLKDVLPSVLPSLLSIINGSVQTGIVPSCLKKAVVQPLLKKKKTLIPLN